MGLDIIRELLCDLFGCEENDITRETSLSDDLSADEEDYIELSYMLEEEFDIPQPDPRHLWELDTVGAIADLVAREAE